VKNADVARVIEYAQAKGVKISDLDAAKYLLARELLDRNPKHTLAQEVVDNFSRWISTGVEPVSFAGFMIGFPETDEEIAEQQRCAKEFAATQEARK
jgi:hypothetical protein